MEPYSQSSFGGGMDYLNKDTDINYVPRYSTAIPNHYVLGVNCRCRGGYLEAIQKPLNITYTLKGKPQGVYGFGNVFITFYSGKAFYKLAEATAWRQVPLLQLDDSVNYIYAEAVTGATNNFSRQANVNTGGQVDATLGVQQISGGLFVSGTPAGILCQDGINRPWIILYDNVNNIATARRLGAYTDWTQTNREYVPIGTKMRLHPSGILFLLAQDGVTMLRSVSGRPCDFMVNIDKDGNKLATEALGGALTVSFAVDFNAVNCIQTGDASTIIIATDHFLYGMTLDYSKTLFGEPTFTKAYQIEAGIVNQFSMTTDQGDTVFIDFDGVKFFNEVTQLKFKGMNGPLSKAISKLFLYNKSGINRAIIQKVCCADVFDNYNLFALNTRFGYCVAVYDNLIDQWVSLDINEATISGIKMFAHLITADKTYIVCQNQLGSMFNMFSTESSDRCAATIYTGAITGGSLANEIKTVNFRPVIKTGLLDTYINVRELVDDQRNTTAGNIQEEQKSVPKEVCAMVFPLRFPIAFDTKSQVDNLTFTMNQGIFGYKLSYIVSWSGDVQLLGYDINYTDNNKNVSQKQQ